MTSPANSSWEDDPFNPYAPPKSPRTGREGQLLIRIVGVPPGEAPETIRRAWVGLVLPVAPRYGGRSRFPVFGVLTGPRGFLGTCLALLSGRSRREDGYAVRGRIAVETLTERSPEAADWWRSNVPHVVRAGHILVFSADVCEEVV